jgi:mRNA interferase RelE/StbE
MNTTPYEVHFSAPAKRALSETLPEAVAAAAFEFITFALAADPKRVGKQLRPPLHPRYSARRGEYRIIYQLDDRINRIDIISITHRRDAYTANQ